MRNSRSRLGAVWGISLFAASACGQMKSASEEGAAASAREQAKGSAAARTPTAEEDTVSEGTEKDPSPSPQATAAPSARADIGYGSGDLGLSGIGHGGGAGPAPGFGNGAAPSKMRARGEMGRMGGAPASPPGPSGIVARPAADPVPLTEAVLDPNGRYATTYRPGAGHLAAFESAVALGIVPAAEREVVSDVGARYIPSFDAPKGHALDLHNELERGKLPPTGGPVHVRLSLRSTAQAATERPPLAVVVVLDVSGSMRGKLIQSARDAATALVDKLDAKDQFSLVTFSTEARVLVPLGVVGAQRDKLKKTIEGIKEEGGTNIGEGLSLGYAEAQKKEVKTDAVKVVMLLSDGRANDGITDRRKLSQLSLRAFENGIQTSSFGLGSDFDGPLMSQIASDGAGGYYYLPDSSQISKALSTELDKRLDPVATAVEVRVRLKPGIDLLNVYGSRRLTQEEASRVRAIEVAQDKATEKRDKIKANRKDDVEGGMRFFMPVFARDDSHSILLKLRVPEGVGPKDLALVEIKYKDRVTKKNVTEEIPLKVEYAKSDAESYASLDPSVRKTVQGFAAGETLTKAAQLIADNRRDEAVTLLAEREGLLFNAAAMLSEPLFVDDAKRLARLRSHAEGKGALKDPLVLAMVLETAGGAHLH